jgi:diguanylate cyclase (GGDEF)-like protein
MDRAATEHARSALGGDVAALIRDGRVVCTASTSNGPGPDVDLILAAAETGGTVRVPGVGTCATTTVGREDAASPRLLVGRTTDPFSPDEVELLRSMLGALRVAGDNLQTLSGLRERQQLLERLSVIQRSIAHRAELDKIFGAITTGLATLLDEDISVIRMIDLDSPSEHVLVASHGLPPDEVAILRRLPLTQGPSGRAMRDNDLVVIEDFELEPPDVRSGARAMGVTAAMAAPLREGEAIVGSLIVASRNRPRRYSASEREVLLAFAEHASLALADAKALEGREQAFHDPLTKLPNRTLFGERLEAAAARLQQGEQMAVLFIDLDRFKTINDSLGHAAGDELLIASANRIASCVRAEDTVARLGGDEFTVLLSRTRSPIEAEVVADRIVATLARPVTVAGRDIVPSASVGIAYHDANSPVGGDLLNAADIAMYHAKAAGRGRTQTFRPELSERARRRLDLESELRSALEHRELHLEYQPLVDLQGDRGVVAAEALLRWQRADGAPVVISELIAVAEETGLIQAVGEWALGAACRQAATWRASGMERVPSIHVNLSGHQLRDPEIAWTVKETLAKARVAAGDVTLEITESVLIGNDEPSLDAVDQLRSLGVRLSLDDFGQGYSSLAYLAQLDIQSLKIDRSFIQRLTELRGADVIVRHVVEMAHELGMSVVAEGTETLEQVDLVRSLGCDQAQGYFFSPPLPPGGLADLLEGRTRLPSFGSRSRVG